MPKARCTNGQIIALLQQGKSNNAIKRLIGAGATRVQRLREATPDLPDVVEDPPEPEPEPVDQTPDESEDVVVNAKYLRALEAIMMLVERL